MDDLRGVERQRKKKSLENSLELNFFFSFFYLKDFLFLSLTGGGGCLGDYEKPTLKKERKGSAQLRVEFVIRRY